MDSGRGGTPQIFDRGQYVDSPDCSEVEAISPSSQKPSRKAEDKATQIVQRAPFIREKFTGEFPYSQATLVFSGGTLGSISGFNPNGPAGSLLVNAGINDGCGWSIKWFYDCDLLGFRVAAH
jgi:hypothetical protein